MKLEPDKLGIKSWAEGDRPREKLLAQGRRVLSDAELIAILIGSGSRNETAVELGKRILHHYRNNLTELGRVSVQELSRFKGIGEAKAISIIAALEIGRRRADTEDVAEPERITCSRDVFYALNTIFSDLSHEEFWILCTNRAGRILSKNLISKGGVSGTIADPKIVFKLALEHNATSVFLAHNHPSGSLKPSNADIVLTKKMADAGRIMDVPVLDHLIFAGNKFFSFADEGLL
ncbi:MAG: DNA repair protein RadC [Mucilaginibacter polytrichastri]|nr:DNA repair protein RadC [Mucilaginibacter polytrichastri]